MILFAHIAIALMGALACLAIFAMCRAATRGDRRARKIEARDPLSRTRP